MSFQIKDLPYAQFEQLGMSKRDVLKMNAQDLVNMLEGGRTSLLSLKISLGEGMPPIQADVKLSLIRNPDNTLSLGVHPIMAKATNTIEATPEQWERMLKGEPIVKDSKTYNGSIEPHIHQLDKQTNEILTARTASIQIPNSINSTVLTPDQKDQIKKGVPVEIENPTSKERFTVQLDLNEQKGFKITMGELARQQELEVKPSIGRGVKM
jgi:hypothetical protein